MKLTTLKLPSEQQKPQAVIESSLLLLLRPKPTNAMESNYQKDTTTHQTTRLLQREAELLPSGAVISFSVFALQRDAIRLAMLWGDPQILLLSSPITPLATES